MYFSKTQFSDFTKNTRFSRNFNGQVTCMVSDGSNIFLGGGFAVTRDRRYATALDSVGAGLGYWNANAVDGSKFSSSVTSMCVQSDGKILISGLFTNYAGTTNRNRLIRLNSDGTLDTSFCTNAVDGSKFNSNASTIKVQSDGKILIGGNFTNYAGTTNRNRLIRLNSDGTLDTSFCTNAVDGAKFGNTIYSIEIQSDGKILVGGLVVSYGGTTGRSYLIRLNSDGTLDTSFCTNAVDGAKFNNTIYSIYVQSDGKILVGGLFTNYAGTTNRSRLIRLNSDGTLDTSFCTNAVDGAKFSNGVYSTQVQSDGKILLGGSFTSYSGTTNRSYLIRLNSDGTIDTDFCTNAVDGAKFGNIIYAILVQSDGKILLAGSFINYNGKIGRNNLIRVNSDGTLDTSFCTNASDVPKFNNVIYATQTQSDSKILIGGAFVNYEGTSNRNRLIRLNSDGTIDTDFCTNAVDGASAKFSSYIYSIQVQSDGKILVGGDFTNYSGTAGRSYLIRLNSDGTLDTSFCTNAVDSSKFNDSISPNTICVQSDGKILVGGLFTNYAGTTDRSRLIRLNSDGTLDTSFCTNAVDGAKFNNSIYSIKTQSDGKILIGGFFINYGGTTGRSYLIRLNSDGTIDTDFCTNAVDGSKINSIVYSVNVQPDGKILFGGGFTYGGTTGRTNLIRLNSDGTLDTDFCANATDNSRFSNNIYSIEIRSDGKMLIGGNYSNYYICSPFYQFISSYLIYLKPDGVVC